MRRLLEDFDGLFDLHREVDGVPLRERIEQTVLGLEEHPLEDWGAGRQSEKLVSESGRFVNFFYRPHLFPGMELKLRLAHKLQFHLLPDDLPPGAPVSIAAVLESYCHLSGDLFGWATLRDGRFLIWIADMAGHGVRSGLGSAVLRVLLDHLPERSRLEPLVTTLNRALHDCIRPSEVGLFATAFFLVLDPDGRAAYTSAGHPPTLVRRGEGSVEHLRSLGRPLGLFDDSTYPVRELELAAGDSMLLYTDGLIEAQGYDGEAFGVQRLERLLREDFDRPSAMTRRIYAEVQARQDIDKLDDDITFLLARF